MHITQLDLFDVGERRPQLLNDPVRKKNGMAGPMGTGPAGETCGSCIHRVSKPHGRKSHTKCALMRACWNHSYGSDIKMRFDACYRWEPREKK
jgi:hypothetical protein